MYFLPLALYAHARGTGKYSVATQRGCSQQVARMLGKQSHLPLDLRPASPQVGCTSNRRTLQRLRHAFVAAAQVDGVHGSSSHVQFEQRPARDVAPYLRSRLTRRMNLNLAIEEACKGVNQEQAPPNLALLFVSSAFSEQAAEVVPELLRRVPSLKYVVGCTGGGVLGVAESGEPAQVESSPALALTLAHLPHTHISLQHLSMAELPDGDAPPSRWSDLLGVPLPGSVSPVAQGQPDGHTAHGSQASLDRSSSSSSRDAAGTVPRSEQQVPLQSQHQAPSKASAYPPTSFIVLADPSFLRLQELLEGLDFAYGKAATTLGGLSSAGALSPERYLFVWSRERAEAAHAAAAERHKAEAAGEGTASEAAQADTSAPQQLQDGQQHEVSACVDPAVQEVVRLTEFGPGMSQAEKLAVKGVAPTGAAVLALQGGVELELLVAQGCRPLSDNVYMIEEQQDSRVSLLKNVTTGEAIAPLPALTKEVRRVVKSQVEMHKLLENLVLGLAPDAFKPPTEPHEFLIRAMGFDNSGAMAIGDYLRIGQHLRFMVRDRQGAEEDLVSHGTSYKRRQLGAMMSGRPLPAPLGTLVFSCNGRGSNLFPEDPAYDARTVSSFVPVPLAGFLCNGEIAGGPGMGGRTQLFGFTCAAGILRPTQASQQQPVTGELAQEPRSLGACDSAPQE